MGSKRAPSDGAGSADVLDSLHKLRLSIAHSRSELSRLYESRQQLLVKAYESGMNMSEVARAAGITREAMYRVLRRNGTQFRG